MPGLGHGWKPTLLSGAVLWLHGDAVSGNDGDAIATWPNSAPTGSANDAVQATAANKPLLKKTSNGLNGHNVLRFDGSNDFMRTVVDLGSTGATFFFVARTGGTLTSYGTICGSGGTVGIGADNPTTSIRWGQCLGNAGDGFGSGWGGPASDVLLGNPGGITTNQAYAAAYRYDKVNWTLTGPNAGVYADTTFPSATYKLHIGCEYTTASLAVVNLPFNGDIAEIIIYNRALTDAEVFAVQWYLEAKYFNSTNLTYGPKLWLDADTVSGADGDSVSAWADQSGFSHDYAQATSARQPIVKTGQLNSHRCVRFGDNTKWMTSAWTPTIATGKTIALVAKQGSAISTGYSYPYSFINGTSHDCLIFFNSRSSWYPWSFRFKANAAGNSIGLGSSAGANTTAAQRVLISYDGGTSTITASYNTMKDGSFPAMTSFGSSLAAGIGETLSIIGGDQTASVDSLVPQLDIFELIVWERQLSSRELTLVDNYLKVKYGL